MLVALRRLEALLVRAEGAAVVAIVATMLVLAGYNIFYRNVLVPIQVHNAHSGPPIELAAAGAAPQGAGAAPGESGKPAKSAAEGFAGDWGEGGDDEDADADDGGQSDADEKSGDDEDADERPDAKPKSSAEGFAGDWGEDDDDGDDDGDGEKSDDDAGGEDEDDPFANLPDIDAVAKTEDGKPRGGPPPEGSFAASFVAFVDDVKVDWIDVFLRQLVILLAFFGAMLATVRSKHFNIDVLSRFLKGPSRRFAAVTIDVFAAGVCLVFADAGRKLVAISREYEKELLPWADEWVFQVMYPFGFGLLALHFAIRAVEDAVEVPAAKAANA
jgi:TRAP-type C4-dicarboxylate transport system permease small subunit